MTDAIVPRLRCSLPPLHPAHAFGTEPGVFVCDGLELRPASVTDTGRERCPYCEQARTLRPYLPLKEPPRGALFCTYCYRISGPTEGTP